MKLYQIANEYQNILEQTFDAETGVVDETALVRLDEIERDIKEKGIAVACYIKNLDADRKAIEEAKLAMAEREEQLNKRVAFFKHYLQSNMERCAINEISCPYFVIKLKKCPLSVDIEDETQITDDYKKVKQITSLDKVKIKEEILAGVVVTGASLKQNLRLEIK